jgi:hypothetical protein
MKLPLQWVWANDPVELPDDDHARCIAASGERLLASGAQRFTLTTRPCTYLSESHGGRSAVSYSTLHMEYRGRDWARGLAQQFWGGDPFDSGPLGGNAQQAAGLALLATVAGALTAGSAVRPRSSSPLQVESDGPGRSLRPAARRPPGHAPRAPRPALLPLTVGCGGDPR